MFSKTISAVLLGMRSDMITVEADVSGGLPYFEMVGYLSAEVKEAKERVRTAIRNAGFKLEPRRIIVNLGCFVCLWLYYAGKSGTYRIDR